MEFFQFQESFVANDLSEEMNAMFVVLEHRYYGQSYPVQDLATENLNFLSSQQALADAANFLIRFRESVDNTSLCCLSSAVVFGCSYSGALSSWFREKYPDLVVGSIAPSGPVEAIFNYSSFFGHFEEAARPFPGCSDRVHTAVTQIASLLETPQGRESLQSTFHMCNPLHPDGRDDYYFKHSITTYVGTAPQFQNPPGWELTSTCAIILNQSLSPVDAFAAAVEFNKHYDPAAGLQTRLAFSSFSSALPFGLGSLSPLSPFSSLTIERPHCSEYSQQAHIAELRTISLSSPAANGRAWFWQKCTEFGFFQTSYPGTSVFFDDLYMEPLVNNCQAAYEIPNMQPHVDQTNQYYGGKNLNATNILFTNGNFDPWSLLSVTVPTATVSASNYDAGHCASLDSATPEDPPSLIQSREDIRNAVKSWLNLN